MYLMLGFACRYCYVPDKRTMQANRDRFERKQLLQVFGEPDYDSPLLSASKTEQKRKSSPATPKDKSSDRKRIRSVKKTSSVSKSKSIPQHKQCGRQACVSRGTSLTHTHVQCFYKTADTKSPSPTTNLLASKDKTPSQSKPKAVTFSKEKTASAARGVTPSNLHQGHLRLNPEKIQVKSIARRVNKEVITLEIALATPRESHSCPETSHFDRF
jgi:hypothetical protein